MEPHVLSSTAAHAGKPSGPPSRGTRHGELCGLLGTLGPLPWCVHGDGPRVDREFCWTEADVIPCTKGVPGGEEFHRILKLAYTHKACWHAVQCTIQDARDRSNDGLVLHKVTPARSEVRIALAALLAYRQGTPHA